MAPAWVSIGSPSPGTAPHPGWRVACALSDQWRRPFDPFARRVALADRAGYRGMGGKFIAVAISSQLLMLSLFQNLWKAPNSAGACATDRRLDDLQPGTRSGISRQRPTANSLHAGCLASLQRPNSRCEQNCCLAAAEFTSTLSTLSSRIRGGFWFAACRSKSRDGTRAALRYASAAVCHAAPGAIRRRG